MGLEGMISCRVIWNRAFFSSFSSYLINLMLRNNIPMRER